MNVYKKLQMARLLLQEKKLTKSGKNTFAKYEYFELQDFLPAVQTIFADTGLCGVFRVGSNDATLTIYNTENPEEYVFFTSPMAAADLKGCHPIQNLGASISYLRRYLYQNALEIVEHDALDATTGSPEQTRPAPKPVPKAAPVAPPAQTVGITVGGTTIVKDSVSPSNDWEIKLNIKPEDEKWADLVVSSAVLLLGMATSQEDVMTLYKRNKQTFDQLKAVEPSIFKELMDKFTEYRNKFKEPA